MSLYVNFTTRKPYTIAELFETIKDYNFSMGKPYMAKQGLYDVIAFPEVDEFNQVVIAANEFGNTGPFQKWVIIKQSHKAGLGNMAKNGILDMATSGITGTFSLLGKNAHDARKMVDKLAEEIKSLNL